MNRKSYILTEIVTKFLDFATDYIYDIKINEKKEINGPAIILANHKSMLDIPLVSKVFPHSYYLAKPDAPMKLLVENIGALPIIRLKKDLLPIEPFLEQTFLNNMNVNQIISHVKNKKLDKKIRSLDTLIEASKNKNVAQNYFNLYNEKLIEFCSELIEDNEKIVIFPQGERTNGALEIKKERLEFYQKIIKDKKVPFYLVNLDYTTDNKSLPGRGTRIRINVSDAIYEKDTDHLKQQIDHYFLLEHRKD